jgi:Ig-like domain-containing protein
VDPSLNLPEPLGPATYEWSFTDFDGMATIVNGQTVSYAALRDEPFAVSITRTRTFDGSQDTLTLRERGNDLDRAGVAPGSSGDTQAPGTALVYDAYTNTAQPCPVITEEPVDVTLAVGEPMTLTVAADPAGGPFAYQWLKDGQPIPTRGLSGGRFGDDNLPVLRLTTASVLDSGSYACQVTNGCGTVSSTAALITVAAPPVCPPDLTGDGTLDFFDVAAFLGAFSAQDPIADLTGDGLFDFFDVAAYLAAFSAGCP